MKSSLDISQSTIERAVAGGGEAISEIIRRLQQPFFGLARRMMLDPMDAEDATQEALLRVVTHLGQFQATAKFSTWAWRVAVNTYIDFKDKRYAGPHMSLEAFSADLADGLDIEATERADDALKLEQLKASCGWALLSTLDAEHRLAYILGDILEMQSDEAAEVLDIEAATFRKRLSRARERVRDALSRNCGVVEQSNACRCHRRLACAQKLGRVGPSNGTATLNLPELRKQLAQIDALQRAAVFYRADPPPKGSRDFTASIREVLRSVELM